MRTGNIVRTSTGTAALHASSSLVLATRSSVYDTTSESSVIALSAATTMVSSVRAGATRQISNRGRRPLWAGMQRHLSIVGVADRRGFPPPAGGTGPATAAPAHAPVVSVEPQKAPEPVPAAEAAAADAAEPAPAAEAAAANAADPVRAGEPAAPAAPVAAGEPAMVDASMAAADKPQPAETTEPAKTADPADDAAAEGAPPAAAEPPPKPAKADRVHLTIDSLQNYELIEPIPVLIDPLGDKVFVAETPDLNISITGSSIGGAFLQLKDQISTIYESLRSKKFLDPERKRQLKMLETYIGKPKRAWYLARD